MVAAAVIGSAWIGAANPWNYVWVDRVLGLTLVAVWISGLLTIAAAWLIARGVWGPLLVTTGLVLFCLLCTFGALMGSWLNPRESTVVVSAESPSGEISASAVRAGHDERFWRIRLESGSGLVAREESAYTAIFAWGREPTPGLRFLDESTIEVTSEGCRAVVQFDPANLAIRDVQNFRDTASSCMWGPDDG